MCAVAILDSGWKCLAALKNQQVSGSGAAASATKTMPYRQLRSGKIQPTGLCTPVS
jgi:hypothetical protein